MRVLHLLVAGLGLALAPWPAGAGLEPAPAEAAVAVAAIAFVDAATGTPVTRIAAGGSVTWTWVQGLHSVTAGVLFLEDPDARDFDSGVRNAAEQPAPTFRHTFPSPGRYSYYCLVHDPLMKGLVVVEA